MKLHELSPAEGSVKENYRKGRGAGSGNGKTAGKGHKGQNARSGGGVRPGFEGGQLPLYRKLPKRGFNNARFGKQYSVINVELLNNFNDGDVVDSAALLTAGIIDSRFPRVFLSASCGNSPGAEYHLPGIFRYRI